MCTVFAAISLVLSVLAALIPDVCMPAYTLSGAAIRHGSWSATLPGPEQSGAIPQRRRCTQPLMLYAMIVARSSRHMGRMPRHLAAAVATCRDSCATIIMDSAASSAGGRVGVLWFPCALHPVGAAGAANSPAAVRNTSAMAATAGFGFPAKSMIALLTGQGKLSCPIQ